MSSRWKPQIILLAVLAGLATIIIGASVAVAAGNQNKSGQHGALLAGQLGHTEATATAKAGQTTPGQKPEGTTTPGTDTDHNGTATPGSDPDHDGTPGCTATSGSDPDKDGTATPGTNTEKGTATPGTDQDGSSGCSMTPGPDQDGTATPGSKPPEGPATATPTPPGS